MQFLTTLNVWQGFAIVATIIYGLMNFLYKVAAENKCSSFYTMSFSGITVSILSFVLLTINGSAFVPLKWLLVFAGANALFFATGSICKIEALKHIPANLTFPVIKLNSTFAVIIAIVFLGERPDIYKILGIILGLGVILILAAEKFSLKEGCNLKYGFMFSLISACSTASSMTIGKLASSSVPKLNYIFISYSCVAVYSLIAGFKGKNKATAHSLTRKTIFFGMMIGTLNFLGYFLVLKAFSVGPMTGVQPIFAMSIVFPIFLSRLIYKEKFTVYRYLALLLSLGSIILVSIK